MNAALNGELIHEVNDALFRFDADKTIGAVVITGSEKAFAGSSSYPPPPFLTHTCLAGADIKEMQPLTYAGNLETNFIGHWSRITEVRKPVIAAVNGFAVRPTAH